MRFPFAGLLPLLIAGLHVGSSVSAQEVQAPVWNGCSDDAVPAARLEGVVVDRSTGAPLPGARVRVDSWPETAEAPIFLGEVRTGDEGSFTACGPAAEEPLRLLASYSGHEGDPEDVEPPAAGVRLAVDLGAPAFLLFSVVDAETGEAVEGVRVDLDPIRLAAVTDSTGQLGLTRVPPLRYRMQARHVAYEPLTDTLRVEPGQRAELRVPLATRVYELAPLRVMVTGRDPYLVRMGFYDRKNRMDEGYFALGEEVRPYRLLSTLFGFKRELIIRYPGAVGGGIGSR